MGTALIKNSMARSNFCLRVNMVTTETAKGNTEIHHYYEP